MPKKPTPPKLTPNEALVVRTLMPITLIWHDFLAKHEYISDSSPMHFNVASLVQMVRETTEYLNNTYKAIGVSQEQFDEIANKIAPLLYPDKPHPDKGGDAGQPVETK